MARYFVEIAYKGSQHSGWQSQPNANTLQEDIEKALSKVLNTETRVVGCGRTDAGVHASQYFLHFDFFNELPPHFLHRLNRMLHENIVLKNIWLMHDEAHARFDAVERMYKYVVEPEKNPFSKGLVYHYPYFSKTNLELLQRSVNMLVDYKEFFPFCKTNSDVENVICDIRKSEWTINENQWTYEVKSNRYLRGMIRLIVGMSLRVSSGQWSIEEVIKALDKQERWTGAWSAPADGLYLCGVDYPEGFLKKKVDCL